MPKPVYRSPKRPGEVPACFHWVEKYFRVVETVEGTILSFLVSNQLIRTRMEEAAKKTALGFKASVL